MTTPPLPEPAAAYAQGCNHDLQVGDLLFTADQMTQYAAAGVAAALAEEVGLAPLSEVSACPHCGGPIDAAAQVPLTDDDVLKMWRASDFRGSGGQADWFAEGIRAAERAHGIGGTP